MSYLLTGLLVYLLYRFTVGFVLPVIRTTRQVKQQFNEMRAKMQSTQSQQTGERVENVEQVHSEKPKFDVEGEYINFEETK